MGRGKGEEGGERHGGSAKGRRGDEGRGGSGGTRRGQRGKETGWAPGGADRGLHRLEMRVPSARHPVQVSGGWPCWRRGVLTPVLGEGESRGTGPGSPVHGEASLSQDEILLGVHEPNLPSSGPGDHCRGSHETAAAMGEGTAHHLREKNPECSCCGLTRRGPKMVPGLTLPWCGCREPASATCQP